jgi:HK97 family phage major capsid protein
VDDANANVLDSVGTKMVRSVALAADRAMFNGTGGKQPNGLLNITPALPSFAGAPDYAGIVSGAGLVRAAGGTPNALYINPSDLTALQLAADANDRPLVSDPATGMGASVAGLTIWPTPATPAGTALVADATQIVIAVREDASVAVSDQFAFNADGTVVRVVARLDVGVNDPDGLAVVKAGAGRASK